MGNPSSVSSARVRSSACHSCVFGSLDTGRTVVCEVLADGIIGLMVTGLSSSDDSGSSKAVLKDSLREPPGVDLGTLLLLSVARRCRFLDRMEACGGVTSGVGGLRWSGGVVGVRWFTEELSEWIISTGIVGLEAMAGCGPDDVLELLGGGRRRVWPGTNSSWLMLQRSRAGGAASRS